MIKPKKLKKGDKVAVVSLSWGGLGEPGLIHRYDIAKKRLEEEFGLTVVAMPNALKGTQFVANHPELRAKDLMDAFNDPSIAAIFTAIGGDDSIRILPYIDFEVIKQNPKIFMGFSDTTVSHFIMYKAGIVSFYGPCVMFYFGEYVKIFEYTKKAVNDILFNDSTGYSLTSSSEWTDDLFMWKEENKNRLHRMRPEEHGYELIQGKGVVEGTLFGGCIDVLMMINGTEIWPKLEKWKDIILFLETSEDKPSPALVKYTLRNLAAQGILKVIKGIIVGKPQDEVFYEEYKLVYQEVVAGEEKLTDLPILYNVNFGHAPPIGVIPIGIMARINCKDKTITYLESSVC